MGQIYIIMYTYDTCKGKMDHPRDSVIFSDLQGTLQPFLTQTYPAVLIEQS